MTFRARGARPALARTAVAVTVLLAVAPATAQSVPSNIIAFGDSITRGDSRFDERNRGGYPARLQGKLRQDNPDAVVHNYGRDGEVTAEGVSRIGSVLAQEPNADALALMEGTNDVNLVIQGAISFQSIETNLATMASRAVNAGLEVFYATVIPRPSSATVDRNDILTFALSRAIRDLASRQQRNLVDPYDAFSFYPGADPRLYTTGGTDAVGHPNSDGFDVLADIFFDVVRGVDTQGPVPGDMEPGYQVDSIGPATDIELTIYDLGAGIDPDNTTLTINGVAVETEQSGNARKRVLFHDTKAATLGCYAKVGIRSADRADPPNVSDHFYNEFRVNGGNILKGDLDRSCRVDGIDLVIVALAFGSQSGEARYNPRADINSDGVVDGRDFAELASNFGRSS